MDNLFTQFSHLPKLDKLYAYEAVKGDYSTPNQTLTNAGRVFRSPSTFINTQFYQDLTARFGGPVRANYYKNKPNTVYDWHTDRDRKCSINFLLSPNSDYLTLGRTPGDTAITYNIKRCEYSPFYPALLNTTIEHCVVNYGNSDRYILAVCPGSGTYEEVLEYLLNYQCNSY